MAVIAGKVAPRFMGAYNSSTTYQFYDAVTHNNKLYFCKKSGTVGKAPTGATDDNWFLSLDGTFADAASLGGETAEQWQTKIDNIQTTSRATLSTAGWYRVAELKSNSIVGANGNVCYLTIQRTHDDTDNENHHLLFNATYNKANFSSIADNSNTQLITKARNVKDTKNGVHYLEIYYNSNANNSVVIAIEDKYAAPYWKAITPTLTSETVDGVVMFTTYDIPANASPVTDLDIAEAMEAWTFERNTFTDQTACQNFLDNYSADYSNHTSYELCVQMSYSNDAILGGGQWKIFGHKTTSDYETQIAIQYKTNSFVIKGRSKFGGTWGTFGALATTADLANYLPLSGGTIVQTGYVPLQVEDSNYDVTLIGFRGKSGLLGSLGFGGVNDPTFRDTSNNYRTLLHTGNSAKVAIQESAPTDTTTLWYDTVNKMCKRYVDGAWQA